MQIESTSLEYPHHNGVAIASPIIPLFPKTIYKKLVSSAQRHLNSGLSFVSGTDYWLVVLSFYAKENLMTTHFFLTNKSISMLIHIR